MNPSGTLGAKTYREFGSIDQIGPNKVRARFRRRGQARTKTFSGRGCRADAKAWLRRQDRAGAPTSRITVAAFIDSIEESYRARIAETTWLTGVRGQLRIAKAFFGSDRLTRIDYDRAEDFLLHVRKGRGDATVMRYCSAMRRVFRFAVRAGHIRYNPFAGLELKEPAHVPWEYLSPKDVAARLGAIPAGELRLFAELAYETGLRRSENAALEVGDFSMGAEPYVTVRFSKSHCGRIVPLTGRGHEIATEILHGAEGRVWALGMDCIGCKVNEALKAAGFATRLHGFRRACATRLHEAGVPIVEIQAWLGHGNILTTRRYISIAPRALFRAAEKLRHPARSDPSPDP